MIYVGFSEKEIFEFFEKGFKKSGYSRMEGYKAIAEVLGCGVSKARDIAFRNELIAKKYLKK